ncbi:MAG TPA: hypothetical protein VI112_06330, partial [Bacteroidia bacterium]|jgi:Cu2+-containing amine oxidase
VRKDIDDDLGTLIKVERSKDETGSRTDFFKDNDLKKVEVIFFDGGVIKKVDWYFAGKTMVYCEKWWTDKSTGQLVDHDVCYLNHQHLISWTRNDKLVDPKSDEFIKMDKELVPYGAQMVENAKR